jgi:hypothetical protein
MRYPGYILKRASAIANATDSPLLRLPAELRNMIFKYAVRADNGTILLCYNKHDEFSSMGTYVPLRILPYMAFGLPRVCRQLYAETATLVYSENEFAFWTEETMEQWLLRRLEAQREVVTRVRMVLIGPTGKNELMEKIRLVFPNIKYLGGPGWLRGRVTCV